MGKYTKLVQNQAELIALKASNDFITPNVTLIYDNRIIDFNPYVPPYDYSHDYLTFVAQESGTFKLSGNSVNYSVDDGETWTTLASNTNSPTIQAGNKIMFKATLTPTTNGVGTFSSTGRFTSEGNVMSLLYGDNFIGQVDLTGKNHAFYKLFMYCTNLTNVENISLPATTLASYCYASMFYGCTSLTTAPELPATTLAEGRYYNMFKSCTSLTTAPSLPATTLAENCYSYMFCSCTSLTTAPALPATTLAQSCYGSMFHGCTSLTTAPELPATTLAEGCYKSMFYSCTSLTTAPELPVTTLTSNCYEGMFGGCTLLTTAPELPATTLANYCYYGMFTNCTSLTTAPELSATTLANSCYSSMFYNCTNLNSITCLATNISAISCTSYWVNGVAANGTFTKAKSMTGWTTGNNGIPSGWTVQDYVAS